MLSSGFVFSKPLDFFLPLHYNIFHEQKAKGKGVASPSVNKDYGFNY